MKKIIYSALGLLILASCGETPKTTKQTATVDEVADTLIADQGPKSWVVVGDYSIDLNGKSAKDPAENNFRAIYSYFDAEGDLPFEYQKKVNQLAIQAITFEGQSKITLEDGNQLSHLKFEQYIKNVQKDYAEAVKENPDMGDWSTDLHISIDTSYQDFVVLEVGNDGYFGGAHGMANVAYSLVDKATAKELKLADVFVNVKKLELIAEDYFREQNEMDKEMNFEDAGFWFEEGFKLNDNFYFTDKLVVFQYNQYEIAPYVMGMPSVEIPLSKVKGLLKISLDKIKK